MKFSYTPFRLIRAKEEIKSIHSSQKKIDEVQSDEEFKKWIRRCSVLPKSKIKLMAYSLTERDMRKLTIYLPHNYYSVKMENLFSIFTLRAEFKFWKILFEQWQDSYQNHECNQFLIDSLENETFFQLLNEHHMPKVFFKELLESKNIPLLLGDNLYNGNTILDDLLKGKNLKERLEYLGIRAECQLHKKCEFWYYAYCEKIDYSVGYQRHIIESIQQYYIQDLLGFKMFLRNFLSKFTLKEMIEFRELARYLDNEIGTRDIKILNKKFENIFGDMPEKLGNKYIDWINLFKVQDCFGEDRRSDFWKKYRFISVKKFPKNQSIVMEFEKYYAIEFLGNEGNGALYIYDRNTYQEKIYWKVLTNESAKFKKELYTYHKTTQNDYRKEHRGNWKTEVHYYLIRNNITERINI